MIGHVNFFNNAPHKRQFLGKFIPFAESNEDLKENFSFLREEKKLYVELKNTSYQLFARFYWPIQSRGCNNVCIFLSIHCSLTFCTYFLLSS